jgi:hypothetical protein
VESPPMPPRARTRFHEATPPVSPWASHTYSALTHRSHITRAHALSTRHLRVRTRQGIVCAPALCVLATRTPLAAMRLPHGGLLGA